MKRILIILHWFVKLFLGTHDGSHENDGALFGQHFDADQNGLIQVIGTLPDADYVTCTGACRSMDRCRFINLNVRAHVCVLIGVIGMVTDGTESSIFTQKRPGFVAGRNVSSIEEQDSQGAVAIQGCGPLPTLNVSQRYGNMHTTGSKVRFICNVGGESKFTFCRRDSTWEHFSACLLESLLLWQLHSSVDGYQSTTTTTAAEPTNTTLITTTPETATPTTITTTPEPTATTTTTTTSEPTTTTTTTTTPEPTTTTTTTTTPEPTTTTTTTPEPTATTTTTTTSEPTTTTTTTTTSETATTTTITTTPEPTTTTTTTTTPEPTTTTTTTPEPTPTTTTTTTPEPTTTTTTTPEPTTTTTTTTTPEPTTTTTTTTTPEPTTTTTTTTTTEPTTTTTTTATPEPTTTTTTTPEPTTTFYPESKYQFVSESKDWSTAQNNCKALGGHLVHITSAEEMLRVSQYLSDVSAYHIDTNIYIGLNNYLDNGTSIYRWTDGTAASYTNWDDGEPNHLYIENCGTMYRNSYFWNNIKCDFKRSSLCEGYPSDTK